MKRRVMQFLFALGFLLTLAAATLWVRGWWTRDIFAAERWVQGRRGGLEFLRVYTDRHTFWLHWARQHPADDDDAAEPTSPWEFVHEQGDPVGYTFLHDGSVRSEWETAPETLWGRLGFVMDYAFGEPYGRHETASHANVALPAWLVVLACTALTGTTGLHLWRAGRRRVREAIGLCVACGYDLRGAAHERCPECGGAIAAPRQV